ncbi:hypothetical protein TB1_029276 [Malus domestica]
MYLGQMNLPFTDLRQQDDANIGSWQMNLQFTSNNSTYCRHQKGQYNSSSNLQWQSNLNHVLDFNVASGKPYNIRRGSNRKQESKLCSNGSWDHKEEWMHRHAFGYLNEKRGNKSGGIV